MALGAPLGQFDSARIKVDPGGHITVYSGTFSNGQGSETTLAQITADFLCTSRHKIKVVQGDTSYIQFGWGSRVSDEIQNLRDLDIKEKIQQEKMRSDRAKHIGEMEKTVLGTLQDELNRILGVK